MSALDIDALSLIVMLECDASTPLELIKYCSRVRYFRAYVFLLVS